MGPKQNESSRFVVATYWRGSGRMNQNTSRPCISFFEKIVMQVQKLCIKTLVVFLCERKSSNVYIIYFGTASTIYKPPPAVVIAQVQLQRRIFRFSSGTSSAGCSTVVVAFGTSPSISTTCSRHHELNS
jgi:hypothetical protein